jgi:hypothetical protein
METALAAHRLGDELRAPPEGEEPDERSYGQQEKHETLALDAGGEHELVELRVNQAPMGVVGDAGGHAHGDAEGQRSRERERESGGRS